jgi:ubiquinone/menaquinone biosynthesis C-methylase UbiE
MKLNGLEFALMNNPVRAALQRHVETPWLLGAPGALVGRRVLEIGCGRGVGVEILLGRGAVAVVGLDLDPRMVARARRRLQRYGDRARVLVGDASALALPDATFDAVVDYGILHHVPDWRRALDEIVRVLKPGGVFYFEDLFKAIVAAPVIRSLLTHPQATQFTAREFREGLEAAGLRIGAWRQCGPWGVVGQASKEPFGASS